MPYGSHSPITLRLTKLFQDPAGLSPVDLQNGAPLVQRAQFHAIVQNPFEIEHLDTWPKDQQEMVRGLLIHSIQEGRPIVFDWEEAKTTSTTIMDFGDTLAVTFRSPRGYPPYKV
jgi:hypothetical protein